MPTRYSALPTAADADRELDDTFGSDDEDEEQNESARLTRGTAQPIVLDSRQTTSIPGAYDFDRERWDIPPPGSPPQGSIALPNDIGNSNGLLPSAPAARPIAAQPSFFRRALGSVLPSHYSRIPSGPSARPFGGGIENDGVFANLSMKPSRPRTVVSENGDIHMVPEDNQKDVPPSYEEAATDRAPPYWETTVHAPSADAGDALIDDLPGGSFAIFFLNVLVSFFFQLVGFLLTYMLHTSHAAKFGSRAGLGLTLFQYGYYYHTSPLAQNDDDNAVAADPMPSSSIFHFGGFSEPSTSEAGNNPPKAATDPTSAPEFLDDTPIMNGSAREWMGSFFMAFGFFIVLSSLIGFIRVKRWEAAIHAAANPPPPPTPEQLQQDQVIRNNLRSIFGIGGPEDDIENQSATPRGHAVDVRTDSNGRHIVIPNQLMLEEARLARDLRAAGLL